MKTRFIAAHNLLVLALILTFGPSPSRAGIHDKGNTVISIGATTSHTKYSDRNIKSDTSHVVDIPWLTEAEIADLLAEDTTKVDPYGGSYEGHDTSIYLSVGYFVIDGLEAGLSGSTMVTLYHGGGSSDLYIYDAELYTKYFFDNDTTITPYVGVKGGMSWLDIGDYKENNTMGGASLGLEFSGMGAFSWFLEYSTQFTWNDGDLTGTEWRNRLYIGITFYFDLFKDKAE